MRTGILVLWRLRHNTVIIEAYAPSVGTDRAEALSALASLIAAKEQAEKERDEWARKCDAERGASHLLMEDITRLETRLRSMCEAMELFISARLVNENGEHAGWRISGKGSVNEAYERASVELDAAKKEMEEK